MDSKNVTGGGVKVTYIETQFVTSDAAGFKGLVQRLTGRSADPPAPAPHRPFPCRRPDDSYRQGERRTAAGAGAGPQAGYHYTAEEEVRPAVIGVSRTPTYLEDMGLHDFIDMADFSDLFYAGATATEEGSDSCYGGNFAY